MNWKPDIAKILRTILLLLPIILLLAGCNSDTSDGKSAEQLAKEHSECFQADVLKLMYDTMGKMAMDLYKVISQGALTFSMVMFAVWFSVKIIVFVSSLKPPPSGEFWNDTLRQLFLCLVCGILASSTNGLLWVLNYLIFPIFNAFLEMGGQILSVVDTEGKTITLFGKSIITQDFVCSTKNMFVGATASESGFPDSTQKMMSCLACAISDRINVGLRIALRIFGMWTLTSILIGILLVLFLVIVKFAFVFYVIDALFKFTMMVVLLPILIICYAFKFTREKANLAFKEMLAASVFMASIAIILATILLTLMTMLTDKSLFGGSYWTKWFSPAIFCLLLVGFLLQKSMGMAQSLSPKIAGAKLSAKVQAKLAGAAAAAVGLVGTLVTLGGAAPIAKKATDAAMKAASKMAEEANKSAEK